METQEQAQQQEYATKLQNEATSQFDSQVQRITQQVSNFIAELPSNVNRFYQEYKLPVLSFVALVVGIVVLRVGLAVIGAINSIPLVKPIFVYRYLLNSSARKELVENIDSTKKEVLGSN